MYPMKLIEIFFAAQVARETSFEDLHKLLLKEMASVVHHSVLCQKQDVTRTFYLSWISAITNDFEIADSL